MCSHAVGLLDSSHIWSHGTHTCIYLVLRSKVSSLPTNYTLEESTAVSIVRRSKYRYCLRNWCVLWYSSLLYGHCFVHVCKHTVNHSYPTMQRLSERRFFPVDGQFTLKLLSLYLEAFWFLIPMVQFCLLLCDHPCIWFEANSTQQEKQLIPAEKGSWEALLMLLLWRKSATKGPFRLRDSTMWY